MSEDAYAIQQFDFLEQEELSRISRELCKLARAVQEAGISVRFVKEDAPSIRSVCSEIRRLSEIGLGFRVVRYDPGEEIEVTLTETEEAPTGNWLSSGQGGGGWPETYTSTRNYTVIEKGPCSLQIVPSEGGVSSTETSSDRQ